MADIDVVPKRRSNIWLWIIALIVIAVIIYALMGRRPNRTTGSVSEVRGVAPAPIAAPLLLADIG